MTPRDRARAKIAQAFRERIERALALDAARHTSLLAGWGWHPRENPHAHDKIVAQCVDDVEAVLTAYRYPLTRHTAMALRLAAQGRLARWHFVTSGWLYGQTVEGDVIELQEFPSGKDGEIAQLDPQARWDRIGSLLVLHAEINAAEEGLIPERVVWPSNISLDDVRRTIERSKDPDAQVVARSMRDGKWKVAGPDPRGGIHELYDHSIVLRPECYAPLPTNPDLAIIADPDLRRAASGVFWPSTAALVAWAEKVVADDQRTARPIALPASRASRVAFEFMARQKALTTDERSNAVEAIAGGGVRVFWDGKPRGEQLTFAFAARDATLRTAFEIVDELGAEGLRDYVILHRMAAAQGRTGTFRWTWEAHRHATRHATRVRSSNTTDDEAREAVVQRLWRLTRAELHVEVERDGRRAWKVVGDDPLVYVTGGVEQGGRIEGMTLRLNKALYEGATRGNKKPYFTPLPEAVLDLPATAFCLAVMLSFSWRYAHDVGGVVELSADDLQRAMDARSRTQTRHHEAAAAHARDTLDRVAAAMGDGCRWEPVEGGKYRVTPPRFWVDSVVHGATPVLPPTTKGAPATGLQLVAWREKHKLSQVAAAGVLGVGVQTIKRAELVPGAALPRAFLKANWGSVTRRGLQKPVEGGDSV